MNQEKRCRQRNEKVWAGRLRPPPKRLLLLLLLLLLLIERNMERIVHCRCIRILHDSYEWFKREWFERWLLYHSQKIRTNDILLPLVILSGCPIGTANSSCFVFAFWLRRVRHWAFRYVRDSRAQHDTRLLRYSTGTPASEKRI
jgi:hypothetical protein